MVLGGGYSKRHSAVGLLNATYLLYIYYVSSSTSHIGFVEVEFSIILILLEISLVRFWFYEWDVINNILHYS